MTSDIENAKHTRLTPEDAAAVSGAAALFATLTLDTGCAICIADRDGNLLYQNARSRDWIAWITRETDGDSEAHVQSTCSPTMLAERLGYVRRVCDEGVAIAYESVSRGMRHLVSLRPIGPLGDGLCLTLARRLRPWERVTSEERPDAIVVHPREHDPGPLGQLSPREFEVLVLIGQGHSYADIARMFSRSVRTIERHRDRICQKIGAENRVDLARFAIRAGLAELPDPADAAMLSRRPYDPLELSEPIRRLADQRTRRD